MSENREISKDMKKSAANQDLAWEEVSVEHIVQDKWIDFRRATYRFPDGTTIVASDEEENYLCVRQYRHGIGQVTTEFVAGGIESSTGREYITADDARTTHEDALTAAKRELEEETGYTSDEWEHLITIPSAATVADNYAYIFRAKNCRRTSEQHTDSTEFLHMVKHSAEEIEELIASGGFQQAMHVMAWLLAQR